MRFEYYLGSAECISQDTIKYVENSQHEDEYMQLMNTICRYKWNFPLHNQEKKIFQNQIVNTCLKSCINHFPRIFEKKNIHIIYLGSAFISSTTSR